MHPPKNERLALREPLTPPEINPALETLTALPRSAECLRHFVLSIEFWISPGGRLRQWIALNVRLAAFLLIRAILLMPVISLVLHEVDGWLSVLLSIVLKVMLMSVLVTVAVLAIGCFRHRLKHFPSSSQGSSRRRK
jgi:hypothetical protein